MPLYPIINYLSDALGNSKILDILFSTSSIYLIYAIAIELFKNRKIGYVAGLSLALYPFAMYYAGSETTETSFTFFVLLGFLLLYKRKIFWASLALVLSILIRPTNDLLNPLLIICSSYILYDSSLRTILKNLSIYGICYFFLMMPWWSHNYKKYDHFVRLNLGFGEMLYGGNNAVNNEGRALKNKVIFAKFDTINDLIKRDNALKKEALDFIKNNPKQFLQTSLNRFKVFLNPLPNHKSYKEWKIKAVSFISIFPLLVGVVLFFLIADKALLCNVLPIILFIGYITVIHTFTIASIRYRFPLEPFFILFSVYSYHNLFNRKRP